MRKKIQDQRGVTIIEMIVSVAIFAVTVIILTEIFNMILEGQRNAISARNLQENIRYAFEVLTKEMRMARINNLGWQVTPCDNITVGKIYESFDDGKELRFKNYHNECTVYSLNDGRLKVKRDDKEGYITPDEIKVSNLQFVVTDSYHNTQSSLTIKMDIETVGTVIKHKQEMKMQTSVSSRYY